MSILYRLKNFSVIKYRLFLSVLFYFFYFLVFFLVYKNYFLYGGSRLHAYGDTLHHVRQLEYVSDCLSRLDFKRAFSLPHFYPRQNTLFYSDTLLFQSLLLVPFRFFIDNPFLLFNIVFLINVFLNYLTSLFVVARFITNKVLVFLCATSLAFSPFILIQRDHFSLLVVWPMFLILGIFKILIKSAKFSKSKFFILALFVFLSFSILLYSSPYLTAMFFPFYMLLNIFALKKNKYLLKFNILVFIFCLSTFVPYALAMKKAMSEVNPHPISNFVVYSAQLTDYLYPYPNRLKLSNIYWKSYAHESGRAYYPPFFLLTVLFYSYCWIKKPKKFLEYINNPFVLASLVCFFLGIVLSLGPFLKINGIVTDIILPSKFLVKLPVFSGMRVACRWIFLVDLSVKFLFVNIVEKMFVHVVKYKNMTKYIFFYFISFILIFSVVPKPINLMLPDLGWSFVPYRSLPVSCNSTLLEIPNLSEVVNRPSLYHKLVFYSTLFHDCNLINGSASYVPVDYIKIWTDLNHADENNIGEFIDTYNIGFIKVNLNDLSNLKEKRDMYKNLFGECVLNYSDESVDIFDCRSMLQG